MISKVVRLIMLLAVLALIALTGSAPRALADTLWEPFGEDAPPPAPQAGSVQTGSYPTNVQMVAETVVMTIDDERAFVKSTFTFQNQGTETESFDVRFPLNTPDFEVKYPPIADFKAFVNNQVVPITIKHQPFYENIDNLLVPWANWPMTFPPGEPVSLDVLYQEPASYMTGLKAIDTHNFILETGAGWFDTIGKGTIIVRLPYPVTDWNVVRIVGLGSSETSHQIDGTDIIWKFENLEPTEDDNIRVNVMKPKVWRDILAAQKRAADQPDSADAHLAYADALMTATDVVIDLPLTDGSMGEMLDTEILELERAIELAPDSVDIRIKYVRALLPTDRYADIVTAYDTALAMDPDDPALSNMKSYVDMFIRPLVPPASQPQAEVGTSTRLPSIAEAMSPTPANTLMPDIIATPEPPQQPSEIPETRPSCPGAAALMVIPLFAAIHVSRRKRSEI